VENAWKSPIWLTPGWVVSIQPLLQDDGHYRRRFPLNAEGVKRLLGLPPTEELPAAPVRP